MFMISSRDFTRSSCSMVTVVVTGHSSRRSTPPRWTPTGNGLQRGQSCWPPLGRTVGRQRAPTWPPLGRISWPPTPAPAMSSRHLYTGHRRGHIQAAPRLRAHRGEPLSQDHPQIPVSMPSLFRFDASAVVHTCSSSHRTPAPLTARRQPQRSPPRLLTDAACDGSQSPPARRPRRTHPHHWHSTDRADDLLHHHHFPSGHTWVPKTRSWLVRRHVCVRWLGRRSGSFGQAEGQRPAGSQRSGQGRRDCAKQGPVLVGRLRSVVAAVQHAELVP